MRIECHHFIIPAAVSLILVRTLLADGCFVSNNYDQDVYAPDQKAAIVWDGSTETMILATKLQSKTIADFGWVIPIKASEKPQVTLGDAQVFYDLSDYFKPIQPEIRRAHSLAAEAESPDIEVLEKKKLDVYDITVLKANDAKALADWLTANNFKLPSDAQKTLAYYSNRDFFFVAVKLDLLSKYKAGTVAYYKLVLDLKSGVARPLTITFKATQPFFPLRISSINKGNVKVTAYVLSHEPLTDKTSILKPQNCFQTTKGLRDKLGQHLPVGSALWVSKLIFDGNSSAFIQDAYFEPVDQKLLNKTNDKAETLYRAIRDGDVEQTKTLLAGFPNINERILILTPLQYAVQCKQRAAAECLISKGAAVNPTKGSQEEPVLVLAVMSEDVNMMKLLVDKGADINAADALNAAVMMENIEAAELFLRHGASVNLKGVGGDTPLHYAVEDNQIQMIRLLLAHGANVDTKNELEETPLHSLIHAAFDTTEAAKLLLDKGANPNTISHGMPVLNEAIGYGDESLVKLLLEKGANVNIKDAEGNTPLQIAIRANNKSMINLLKEYGSK